MKNEIINTFEHGAAKLLNVLSKFPDEKFNEVPFDGSWTAAQVADHISRSQRNIPKLLAGNTSATDRDAQEKRELMKNIFLDLNTKMSAPEFILPSEEPLLKQEVIEGLSAEKTQIISAFNIADLSLLCTDFSLPGMGMMTGAEWAWFIIYHMQRHIHQLENIYQTVTATNSAVK